MAEAKELKKSKKIGIILAAGAGVVLAGYLGLCARVEGGGMMPNLTLGGVDIGGMSLEQAQQALDQAMEEHAGKGSVTLTYGDWSGTITGDQLQTFGQDSVLGALQIGRENFFVQGAQYIRYMAAGDGVDAELKLGYEGVAQQALEDLLNQAEQAVCG